MCIYQFLLKIPVQINGNHRKNKKLWQDSAIVVYLEITASLGQKIHDNFYSFYDIKAIQFNTSKMQQTAASMLPNKTTIPDNQETPSKSPRTHRIFKEGSPRQLRNQSISPPPKMMASQTTFDNGSSSRQRSPPGDWLITNRHIFDPTKFDEPLIDELKRIKNHKQVDNSLQWEARIAQNNKNYGFKINELEKQLNNLRLKINEMEKQRQINLDQIQKWKKHLQEAQTYISQLLQEINGHKAQLERSKKQIGDAGTLSSQNTKLSTEISNLNMAIEKIKAESDRLRGQIQQLNANGQQYRIQINEYSLKIQTLTKEKESQSIRWQGIVNQNNNDYSAKLRQLQMQIEQLKRQISQIDINKGKQWQNKYNALKRQTDSFIEQLKQQVQNLKNQINDLSQKKQNQSKVSQQSIMKIRGQYELIIKNLRGEIQNLKNQLNALSNNKSDEIKRYEQKISKTRMQYEQRIKIMTKQIEEHKTQIKNQKNSPDRERQMSQMKNDYEYQLKELWQKLKNAEEYIQIMTKQHRVKITQSQKLITELKIQIEKMGKEKMSDEYLYKVDAKYEQIRRRLITLSSKNNQAINSQSQFWQTYRQKRKKDLEEMQSTINQSLEIMSHIEQTVIVKRTELRRLDLTKLEEIVTEIAKIKNDKKQLSNEVRQQIQTKFYGLLKSVSTQIPQ